MIAKRISATLYLEGVRVDFDNLSLSMTQGQPNTLTVDLTPLKEFFDIYPRTLVQAFYDDGAGPKVFFEGEVAAHGFSKTAQGGRSMRLTCQDFSNYWLYSYTWFLKQGNQGDMNFSMEDEVRLFTGLSAAEVNDVTKKKRVFPIRGIGDTVMQLFSGANKDVVAGLRDLLKAVASVNAFYQTRFQNLKIKERLFSMPDNQLRFMIDPEVSTVLRELLQGQDNFAPIFGVVDMLAQICFQNLWPMSIPSADPKTGAPINFAFLPASSFLTAPPRCNVIFPDLHEGFEYSRNLLAEPTRMEMFVPSMSNPQIPQFYLSPPGFRNLVQQVKDAQSKNQSIGFQNLLIQDPNPELDETLRGIVPIRLPLQLDVFSKVRASAIRGADQEAAAAAVAKKITQTNEQIVDFNFVLKKFEGRSFPVAMPFNPNLHPAFPILLLDREAHLFGSPRQIVHTLDADGHASTQVQCTYARHKDVIGDILSEPPPWVNRSFVPDAIGEDAFAFTDLEGKKQSVQGAYPAMMGGGMRSILSQILPVYDSKGKYVTDRKPKDQQDAAELLFAQYQRLADKSTFVSSYTARPIMTMDQSLAFLGVSKVNAELLDGPIYDAVKRGVITSAKSRLVAAGGAVLEV